MSYSTVNSATMKRIYDTVNSMHNQPIVRYNLGFDDDDDYDDNTCNDYNDDDYSDDEGTTAPINAKTLTNYSEVKPKDPLSQLLTGYTNENWEINVDYQNTLNTLGKKLLFYFKNFRSNHYQLTCLKTILECLTSATVAVQLAGIILNGRVLLAVVWALNINK